LPPEVPSEKVRIQYVLYGNFGAHGGAVSPHTDVTEYKINTLVEGRPAQSIRAVLWAPGCKFVTLDAGLDGAVSLDQYFLCDHLQTVTLRGRITKQSLLGKKPVEVSVRYLAGWECTFFGFMDCMVPTIELETVQPDATGLFEIELPDFSDDPIAAREDAGTWQLVLREVKTWNLIEFLQPKNAEFRSHGSGLRVSATYPDLEFTAQNP
jgi:hypothetical protein